MRPSLRSEPRAGGWPLASLPARYGEVRAATLRLAAPLSAEDQGAQSMPDASPTKWHLAHTTWFFDTFVLARAGAGRSIADPRWGALFNSYYLGVGRPHPRSRRGLLTRPALAEVLAWRVRVDDAMATLLDRGTLADAPELRFMVELGLHHEQQHQELLVMDAKHLLGSQPLRPAFRARATGPRREATPLGWCPHPGGLVELGHGGAAFAFDNERPRHRTWLEPFALADRAVTCGEYRAFIADGGYERPELWLSDGWESRAREGWIAPLYWDGAGAWEVYTLGGARPIDPAEPVCHVSYYEADAYARWSGARLPTEAEWEVVAAPQAVAGNLLEADRLHPIAAGASAATGPRQLFGDVWEWTASPYVPYPGFRPFEGAVGEYNGKFMANQFVLRGGCCATPGAHLRATYRNFYPPAARWPFTGIRLARDGA